MPYEFLSDEWLAEARKISVESGATAVPPDISLNVVVTETPDGDRQIHFDAGTFATGLLDGAPTKLTLPYPVAKQIFIDGNQQAAMQAFMAGQIKVEGDMTKVMALQSQPVTPERTELQKMLKEITLA
jgi:hypothetical protein